MQVEPASTGLLQQVFALRILAWKSSHGLSSLHGVDEWKDDHDTHATHLAVVHEGQVIAAARLCVHAAPDSLPDEFDSVVSRYTDQIRFPVACLNRLVVHPAWQRMGLSTRLDVERINRARGMMVKTLLVCTHGPRQDVLRRRGFEELGAVHYPADHVLGAVQGTSAFALHLGRP